ncbi:MAG: GNAT family N-acetyltransferase [Phaeodactylibacter sp.]|nr:GNAT family N-acetyltransferase [Phaeodactylibacter sp.]
MLTLLRTTAEHPDFLNLVRQLDQDLAQRDGAEHAYYAQFNKVDQIRYAVVAYLGEVPVGCGAIKAFDADSMEVKRMYVPPVHRGKGIATQVLQELEAWAKSLGMPYCVLETGKRQPEAIALYTRNGYEITPNYGQYVGVENSVCFRKVI